MLASTRVGGGRGSHNPLVACSSPTTANDWIAATDPGEVCPVQRPPPRGRDRRALSWRGPHSGRAHGRALGPAVLRPRRSPGARRGRSSMAGRDRCRPLVQHRSDRSADQGGPDRRCRGRRRCRTAGRAVAPRTVARTPAARSHPGRCRPGRPRACGLRACGQPAAGAAAQVRDWCVHWRPGPRPLSRRSGRPHRHKPGPSDAPPWRKAERGQRARRPWRDSPEERPPAVRRPVSGPVTFAGQTGAQQGVSTSCISWIVHAELPVATSLSMALSMQRSRSFRR
jgi:hypothetical protein